MPNHPDYVTRTIDGAFEGKHAHPTPALVLRGVDAALAGANVDGMPHTIYQIVNHLVFWQDLDLEWIHSPEPPGDVDNSADWSWPAQPADEAAWTETLDRLLGGLERVKQVTAEEDLAATIPGWGDTTRLEILQTVASHNSFHLGQIVQMRRQLDAWPPEDLQT